MVENTLQKLFLSQVQSTGSKGYYFTTDFTDCNGDGCDWDIDHEQILCDYFGVEELKEMS